LSESCVPSSARPQVRTFDVGGKDGCRGTSELQQPTQTAALLRPYRKNAGTAQNRKIYAKHGAHDPMFGVPWSHLRILAKRSKKDHELALKLWDSGNYDARILATMIANPDRLTLKQVDRWAKELS
jgi:3-methyladenine DNA glycosylase AlkD